MNDNENSNNQSEIDFVDNSSFKRSIRRTKWRQFILYTIISIITVIICLVSIVSGSKYLITNKMQKESNRGEDIFSGNPVKGAGIINSGTRYDYNLFSGTGETTFYKKIGDRKIVWDIVTKKYPAIGNVEVLARGSGMIEINEMNEEAQRVVRYNQLNNERIIDFYYANISYDYLPQELEVAVGLDKNKFIEVALSFNKPMTPGDLGEVLGYKNVDWLWVSSETKEQREQIEELKNDSLKVKNGDNAYGYGVSETIPYSETFTENITVSGAIVSGTPQDLKRFLELDIVRASVIGATIDKY